MYDTKEKNHHLQSQTIHSIWWEEYTLWLRDKKQTAPVAIKIITDEIKTLKSRKGDNLATETIIEYV